MQCDPNRIGIAEGGELFMARLNEGDLVLAAAKCTDDAVDAIVRVAYTRRTPHSDRRCSRKSPTVLAIGYLVQSLLGRRCSGPARAPSLGRYLRVTRHDLAAPAVFQSFTRYELGARRTLLTLHGCVLVLERSAQLCVLGCRRAASGQEWRKDYAAERERNGSAP
jgi:hypothetical protein